MASLLLAIIYLSFISLGLPDSVLGAAWPSIYPQFGVPLSYAGIVSTIISIGTISSCLLSDRLTRWLGTGKLTLISVGLTAAALFGFSISGSFIALCLWAVPYGLGAGSVDAGLNNYVALHYKSQHMSWLHCFWGVGASIGPYIMGYTLTTGQSWNQGYRYISLIQICLTVILLMSLPIWKKRVSTVSVNGVEVEDKALSLREILAIRGTKEVLFFFFCYCALEQVIGLWAGSYLNIYRGLSAELSAKLASMYFLGLTFGRGLSGFISMKLHDTTMIRLGLSIIGVGLIVMLLPMGTMCSIIGLVLIGLGCAPVYPCIIHSTPEHFGPENSQAIIGVQMASAYSGICLMPPLFGIIAKNIDMVLFPWFSLVLLVVMYFMHEKLIKKTAH